MAGPGAWARLTWVKLGARLGLVDRGVTAKPVPLRLRSLAGNPLWIRPGTPDLATIGHNCVYEECMPPASVRDQDLRQIVELGTYIGTGLAVLAARYPNAKLLGVEPDPRSFELARMNSRPYADRVALHRGAVWSGRAALGIRGEWPSGASVEPQEGGEVQGISLYGLLERYLPDGVIDYMWINLEGSEAAVLDSGEGWAERTRSVKVEVHPDRGFGYEDCARALAGLGYEVESWGPRGDPEFAVGIRDAG